MVVVGICNYVLTLKNENLPDKQCFIRNKIYNKYITGNRMSM